MGQRSAADAKLEGSSCDANKTVAENAADLANARLNLVRKGSTAAQQAQVELQKARNPYTAQDLQAAQASVEQAQAQLDLAALGVRESTITAPVAGVIGFAPGASGTLVGIGEGNQVARLPVRIGPVSDHLAEIVGGVQEGQLIAISGLADLIDGDVVAPQTETRTARAGWSAEDLPFRDWQAARVANAPPGARPEVLQATLRNGSGSPQVPRLPWGHVLGCSPVDPDDCSPNRSADATERRVRTARGRSAGRRRLRGKRGRKHGSFL